MAAIITVLTTAGMLLAMAVAAFTLREKWSAHRHRHEPGAEVAALRDIAVAIRSLTRLQDDAGTP